MSYRRTYEPNWKLQNPLLVLTLLGLLLVACGGSGSVVGTLTDQYSGKPLMRARVVLCRMNDEKSCVVASHLTSLTNNQGEFQITDVQRGKYVVIYNGTGDKRDAWEDAEISFTPLQPDETSLFWSQGIAAPTGVGVAESLGASSFANCAWSTALNLNSMGELETGNESGYLYIPDRDLAFVLIDGEPLSVDVRRETPIDLSVWNTRNGECDGENFEPMQ